MAQVRDKFNDAKIDVVAYSRLPAGVGADSSCPSYANI